MENSWIEMDSDEVQSFPALAEIPLSATTAPLSIVNVRECAFYHLRNGICGIIVAREGYILVS